jgi:hypothetical protein
MELKKCPNRRSVMSQLDSLPKGLYETYDQILLKIDEQADHTKTFLRWLCFSVCPMGLAEISETIVVDLDTADGPQYMPDNRYWDVRDVLVKCSGLVTESEGTREVGMTINTKFTEKDNRTSQVGPLLDQRISSFQTPPYRGHLTFPFDQCQTLSCLDISDVLGLSSAIGCTRLGREGQYHEHQPVFPSRKLCCQTLDLSCTIWRY